VTLALSACDDADVRTPPELVGIWKLTDASSRKFPTECRTLQLEFTPDRRLITMSGELLFIVKISTSRRNGGFVVRQEILEHNNKPNCQGKSAHHVRSNFVFEMFWERDGEILRQYIWTKNSGRFIEFVRAN
jgi:hypothetical protein